MTLPASKITLAHPQATLRNPPPLRTCVWGSDSALMKVFKLPLSLFSAAMVLRVPENTGWESGKCMCIIQVHI